MLVGVVENVAAEIEAVAQGRIGAELQVSVSRTMHR